MIGKIIGTLTLLSLIFSIFSGNLTNMSDAVIDGAENAVQLLLSLVGMMALWSGVMEVFSAAGCIRFLAKLLMPIMRLLFPTATKNGVATEEIAAALAANLLGLGNAATPLAIAAMKKLDESNGGKETASDDMITFVVLGCGSFVLLPSTMIALRAAAGSERPFEILLPVWVCSALTMLFSVVICRLANRFSP